MNSQLKTDRSNLLVPLAIVAVVLPLAGLGWWWLNRDPGKKEAPPISAEAKEYVRSGSLGLSGVEMKAMANFTGAAVIEITGNITNKGNRPLQLVELNCVFYDTMGQVVLRERVPIVKRTLAPNNSAAFRLPFEGLPESWNRQMPQLVIANIVFGQ